MRNILCYSLVLLIPLISYSFDNQCEKSLSTRKKSSRSFEQAQEYVHQKGITSSTQYIEMKKNGELPNDMPSHPDRTYKNKGWKDWGHFLGTSRISTKQKSSTFRAFTQAQAYVQENNITSGPQYYELYTEGKLPDDMPSHPDRTYKNKGWKGWGHFLGTNRISNQQKSFTFRVFKQAQKYVQDMGIKTREHYHELYRKEELPNDMPYEPAQTYKDKGWVNWEHFLGTQLKTFEQAQTYVQNMGIKTREHYRELYRKEELPNDMPYDPAQVYEDKGWKGWPHFLGTLKMMKFKTAQSHALDKAGIETVKELIEWLKSENRPPNFPEEPHLFYEEWTNAKDFLKIQDSSKMNYAESKHFMQSLHFKNEKEAIKWLTSDERLEELPIDPHIFYSKEWEGWDVYLGLSSATEDLLERLFEQETNGTILDILERLFEQETNGTTLDIPEIDYEEELVLEEYDW